MISCIALHWTFDAREVNSELADWATVQLIVRMLGNANDAQATAIGTGLGRVALGQHEPSPPRVGRQRVMPAARPGDRMQPRTIRHLAPLLQG
jgi:hypothetical protein